MSYLKYIDNGQNKDKNKVIDTINELNSIEETLSAEDRNSLVDAWVDLLSWYPLLAGPNSDAAKDAIKNTLGDMTKYNDALTDAIDLLNQNNGNGKPPPNITPPPPPRDPLVLDTDKDGFISTVALEDSNAYFDLTGDGIKERVSWISPNDGILAYDKNENAKIDGIDEVFGNFEINGFTELRQLIDSNNDGVIDRRDELFNRLQIWHDNDGDGSADEGELVRLKDEGVKSIDLNARDVNIAVVGGNISEVSTYTDSEGNLELAADVNLEYDPRITTVDTSTIPDYTVDESTRELPTLRGYGLVYDSFISYNADDNFKVIAQEYSNDLEKTATNFEEFMSSWSGYNAEIPHHYGIERKFV